MSVWKSRAAIVGSAGESGHSPRSVVIHACGWWSPGLPDWPHAAAALRGQARADAQAPHRPCPRGLVASERRRAPDAVLMALQVAEEACAAAGQDASQVPSVFASAHGDLAIVDAMCRTLAANPLLLSPLRFHHSVHNAASGYWAIGAGNHQASTALAAAGHSFAAGLMEAAVQCATDGGPVLLVGTDTEALGPLQSVNRSRGQLALALLLSPQGPGRRLRWQPQPGRPAVQPVRSAAAQALSANAMGDALPLFEALAVPAAAALQLALHDQLALQLQLDPA